MLFVWGGVVAALYTIGLAHLGSRLTGRELASANAAFVFCYGFGMLIGPQVIGIGMDVFGRPASAMRWRCFSRSTSACCAAQVDGNAVTGLTFRARSLCVAPVFR